MRGGMIIKWVACLTIKRTRRGWGELRTRVGANEGQRTGFAWNPTSGAWAARQGANWMDPKQGWARGCFLDRLLVWQAALLRTGAEQGNNFYVSAVLETALKRALWMASSRAGQDRAARGRSSRHWIMQKIYALWKTFFFFSVGVCSRLGHSRHIV